MTARELFKQFRAGVGQGLGLTRGQRPRAHDMGMDQGLHAQEVFGRIGEHEKRRMQVLMGAQRLQVRHVRFPPFAILQQHEHRLAGVECLVATQDHALWRAQHEAIVAALRERRRERNTLELGLSHILRATTVIGAFMDEQVANVVRAPERPNASALRETPGQGTKAPRPARGRPTTGVLKNSEDRPDCK